VCFVPGAPGYVEVIDTTLVKAAESAAAAQGSSGDQQHGYEPGAEAGGCF